MAATDQNERAADLLERLLKDRAFRASFRQNPAAAARKYGLDDLAEELSGKGKALYTLEIRESRSSLAGMLMAAAAEGVSASDLADQAGQGRLDTPARIALTRALSRVDIAAISGPGAAAGEDAAQAGIEAVDPEAAGPALKDGGQGLDSGVFAGVADEQAEPAGASDTMQFSAVGAPPVGDAPGAAAGVAEPPAPAGAAADLGSAAAGAGGGQATIDAVLADPDLDLPAEAVADLRSGEMDPRLVMLLHKMGNSGHEVGLSVIKSGHRQFTSGGSVSNHFVGRGFDVATVDGKPVDPSNLGAKDLAEQLADLPPELRPTEIGTPWQIDEEGFFTDGAHCNHLHIGWDGPCPDSVRTEFEAGTGAAAPAQAAAGAAGAPAGSAGPEVASVVEEGERNVGRQSGVFSGIVGEEAKKAANGDGAARSGAGTMQFSAVRQGEQPVEQAGTPTAAPDPADLATGPNPYPGDDAPKEAIAAWMSREAQKRGLPGELPVMAALVESNLTNVNYGDADSLGYFQMRTSIWDQGEYAGFAQDPQKQLDWFLDTAVAVKEKRASQGYTAFLDDPNKWGEWIADVERPAEQYRGRYQLRLDEARGLLANAPAAPAAPAEEAAQSGQPQPGGGGAADLASAAGGEAGGAQATIEAVINDPDLNLPPEAVADLRSGELDPRTVMLLHKLGNSGHEVGLSVIKSGHRQFTSGGSVSNHFVGRGFDIATVDGQPVTAENEGARDIAEQLAEMDPNLRPTEIGTPWQIDKPGFFTDSAHCNHLHIGWDGPCPDAVREDFNAGTGVAAPAAGPAAEAGVGPAGAQVAPVVEEAARNVGRQSGVFAGIVEDEAKKEAEAAAKAPHSTVQFMQAIGTDAPEADAAAPTPASAGPAPSPDADVVPAVVDALPGEYPGDDAPKEEIARWMAARAQAAGLPAELPVMAALVESNLTNVNYGDADSLGYFQMRTSIWDRGEYQGFSQNPELQLKWFIDTAVAVKEKRIAQGYTAFVDDPSKWGEWIADVERPAEQYRGRYQLKLPDAQALLGPPPAA